MGDLLVCDAILERDIAEGEPITGHAELGERCAFGKRGGPSVNYFNLNEQTEVAIRKANRRRSAGGAVLAEAPTKPTGMSPIDQASMFIAIALGVVAKPAIDFLKRSGSRPEWLTDPFLIIGLLLVALFQLPAHRPVAGQLLLT